MILNRWRNKAKRKAKRGRCLVCGHKCSMCEYVCGPCTEKRRKADESVRKQRRQIDAQLNRVEHGYD